MSIQLQTKMTQKKRGRKPIGDKPMTAAEKQKAYRERKKALKESTAYFSISGKLVEKLDTVASQFELSRTQALSDIAESSLKGLLPILSDAANEVQKLIRKHGGDSLPEKERIKLEREIKHQYWQFLLNKFESNEATEQVK